MRVSIIGFGDFGRLITKHLVARADVAVYDRSHNHTQEIEQLGAQPVDLQEAAEAEIVILAVTLDALESTLQQIAPHLNPGTLVMDVTSVKITPVEIMKRLVPANCQILATHPLFGPNTANESLVGHKIVIDPIRVDDIDSIETFLTDMGLEIVHMTADEHDREMAWVHALTFFVGRGLLNINPPKSDLSTNYYNELMDVVDVERTHSLELFNTIQRGNPYAKEMRQKFIASLNDLEQKIQQ